MEVITIHGGRPLRGAVRCQGSKNAALPIMAASILADEPIILDRVPDVTDVNTLALVLGHLGIETKRHTDGRLHLLTVDSAPVTAEVTLVDQMRASFCVLGPLLARRGRAVVALPGGCRIGPRGIDLHLSGLTALGAHIRIENGYVIAKAKALHGAEMDLSGLRGPTVTGTANVMMAAVLARGETIIRSAAREPEIVDLGEFLISLGARIDGLGTSTLRIRGVTQLGGAGQHGYRIIADRMEAGTMLLAASITGGDVTVDACQPNHLDAVLAVLDDAGIAIHQGRDWVRAAAPWRPLSFHLTALPYPGIPTDLQPMFTALAAIADGHSTIADYVFPRRFAHLEELKQLEANIELNGSTASVNGMERFSGGNVVASDLRAAATLILAGLAANGCTTIGAANHLKRGYDRFVEKLRSIGADVHSGDQKHRDLEFDGRPRTWLVPSKIPA